MAFVSFYFRELPNFGTLAIITSLSIEIILIMLVYRIPFFYSLLVSLCGFIAGALLEAAVMISGEKIGVFNQDHLKTSTFMLSSLQFITAVVTMIIVYILQSRKFGFLFKTKNLSSRTALKGYNFIIASILVIGIGLTQFQLYSYYNNAIVSQVITLITAVVFLIGIFLAYKHNKSIIRETYERPIKDELDRSLRNENRSIHPK
ncbi:hypothetical protein ACVNS2_09745 [Paenibacillus caseinilyticus]|nr:hypothetical protein [Paenibacillus mucilaginosus]